MTRIRAQKTSFSAGEISPELLGRGDLRAYENGALKLRNIFIHPTGGVIQPLWRIEQDVPLPFTLLSVSSELSVTG